MCYGNSLHDKDDQRNRHSYSKTSSNIHPCRILVYLWARLWVSTNDMGLSSGLGGWTASIYKTL